MGTRSTDFLSGSLEWCREESHPYIFPDLYNAVDLGTADLGLHPGRGCYSHRMLPSPITKTWVGTMVLRPLPPSSAVRGGASGSWVGTVNTETLREWCRRGGCHL